MQFRTQTTLCISALLLCACTGVPKSPASLSMGIDGEACAGPAPAAVEALSTTNNAELLKKAQYGSGKGGTCTAQSFAAVAPLQVYRVYDAQKPWTAYGGWWAMTRPSGPREDYRAQNAICSEWSKLDRLIACQVKVGAEIVIGTTQSVTCEDGTVYAKNTTLQVYIPNDQKNGVLHVENCREEGSWP